MNISAVFLKLFHTFLQSKLRHTIKLQARLKTGGILPITAYLYELLHTFTIYTGLFRSHNIKKISVQQDEIMEKCHMGLITGLNRR